jgi:hypothetical protein
MQLLNSHVCAASPADFTAVTDGAIAIRKYRVRQAQTRDWTNNYNWDFLTPLKMGRCLHIMNDFWKAYSHKVSFTNNIHFLKLKKSHTSQMKKLQV